MPLCPYCSQEQEFELLEVWSSREFMISTCCEQSEEEARWSLSEDPVWARAALRHLGIEEICGETLRRVADDGCGGADPGLAVQASIESPSATRAASSIAIMSTYQPRLAGGSAKACGTGPTF